MKFTRVFYVSGCDNVFINKPTSTFTVVLSKKGLRLYDAGPGFISLHRKKKEQLIRWDHIRGVKIKHEIGNDTTWDRLTGSRHVISTLTLTYRTAKGKNKHLILQSGDAVKIKQKIDRRLRR